MTTLRAVFRLLTPSERRRGVTLVGLMLVGMVLETLGAGVVIPAVALLTQNDLTTRYPRLAPVIQWLGNPSQATLVTEGMVALVAVYLVKAVFLAFLAWRQTQFGYSVQASLSQRLFEIYLRQPYVFHLERNSAQLIRNAVTEVAQFTFNVFLPLLLLMTESFVLFGLAVLLIAVEPVGTVIVGIVLGLASWGFYGSTRGRMKRWGVDRQVHEGLRLQHLQQGLGGAKEVKLLGREDDFLTQYREHNERSSAVTQYQVTLQLFPRLWLEVLAVTALALLVVTMLGQGRRMDQIVPALGLFAAAAFRMMPSANRALNAIQGLRYGLPVIDVLRQELSLPTDVPAAAVAGRDPLPLRETIELTNVSFTYPTAATPSIQKLSMLIRRGESVGVTGSSGSGKTTLVDLILGLLTPDGGTITVDGADIQRDMRRWQNQIGYVPQQVYLTDDTLRRNVAFGVRESDIDNAAVQRALRAAQLEAFIESLPSGAETLVGERGVRLSGGQRQRIGIARALYHDPNVLVLDEATSALDHVTEQGVMDAVTALHGSKTILIVAHRLSTVTRCDRLYRLESGRVVAAGRPEELVGVAQMV
jgi:ABC-type multidrug transport system fused ATPase/permease subunit